MPRTNPDDGPPAAAGEPDPWQRMLDALHAAGADAGATAADWWAQDTVGGRASGDHAATVRRILAGIDDVDPLILDALPGCNLSTQDADTPTGAELYADAAPADAPGWDALDAQARAEALDAFRDGYHTAVQDRAVEHCRTALPDDNEPTPTDAARRPDPPGITRAPPADETSRTATREGAVMNAMPGSGDNIEPDGSEPLSVGDPVLCKTRLLSRQCATCIFRPGNPMHLAPNRLRQFVAQARGASGYIICHSTLPYVGAGAKPAVCRGFADRYSTWQLQLIARLWGFVEVDPPDDPRPAIDPGTAGDAPATG